MHSVQKKLLLAIIFIMPTYHHVNAQISDSVPFSFMFIIDNSGSNTEGTDPNGIRFQVVKEVIDFIYEKDRRTKIGLVLFGSRLWFYGPDNESLFVSVPEDQFHDGDGCYIPPMDLVSESVGTAYGFEDDTINYSKSGIDILKMYLETKDKEIFPNKFCKVSKYEPTHVAAYPGVSHSARLTNITRAICAANQAHLYQTPQIDKSKHVNIFLSDGNAGLASMDPDYMYLNDYIKGENTPSTITFFYNPDQGDLSKLNQMTENIKSNGYSESNSEITDMIPLDNWDVVKTRIAKLFDDQTVNNNSFKKVFKLDSNVEIKQIYSNEYQIRTKSSSLRVDIFNVLGRKIASINSTSNSDGETAVKWRGDAVGRYFLKIKAGDKLIYRSIAISN